MQKWLERNDPEYAIPLRTVLKLAQRGGTGANQHSKSKGDNVTSAPRLKRGNRAEYTVARLARDAVNVLLALFLFGISTAAQTLSPPIVECSAKKCAGTFIIRNDGLTPMATTAEVFSTVFANGKSQHVPLLPSVHVQLGATSARIAPMQSYGFDYRIKCDIAPCAVAVSFTMQHGVTREGLAVEIQLISTVYACEKAKGCRDAVRARL